MTSEFIGGAPTPTEPSGGPTYELGGHLVLVRLGRGPAKCNPAVETRLGHTLVRVRFIKILEVISRAVTRTVSGVLAWTADVPYNDDAGPLRSWLVRKSLGSKLIPVRCIRSRGFFNFFTFLSLDI